MQKDNVGFKDLLLIIIQNIYLCEFNIYLNIKIMELLLILKLFFIYESLRKSHVADS